MSPFFIPPYFNYFYGMNADKITIAIDGFSSCGKSTLAKDLAQKIGYVFIDSGAMYRGISLYAIQHHCVQQDELNTECLLAVLPEIELHFERLSETEMPALFMNGVNVSEEIRLPHVSNIVSKVAALKPVREKLVAEQRKMGKNGGIVMDGRDIGSVVFPHAELKLFVTASIDVRVERRYLELQTKGIQIQKEEVRENLEKRDHLDSTRAESPLIQPSDAILIDNTHLNREEQLERALSYFNRTIEQKKAEKK